MTDHLEWQRQTARAKYQRDKAAAQQTGAPIHEAALIQQAAAYVGATPGDVRDWVRGL